MGTNSLPAPAPRRRSFNLPSFRRSSAAERQEVVKNAEELSNSVQEAARVQKEAAWQWYSRGAGEAVLLPRPSRPPVRNPQALVSSDDKSCASGPRSSTASLRNSSMRQEKLVNPLPLADQSHRAASRFKPEARISFAASGVAPPAVPTLPAAPSGGPSTPLLYDELEVSSLRTHMADFVQRLQHQGNPYHDEHSSPARPPGQHQTKAPPAVSVASAGNHCSSAAASKASKVPFHIKPFSALQKLLRKVLSGSVPKCTVKSFPQIIDGASAAVYDNDVDSTNEYHHHHCIHHHHHHYHFSESPQEHAYTILSRRRHSESGSSRPCSPTTLVEAGSDEEEDQDEVEERRIAAYLERRRRRRRHSDSFSRCQLPPENAGSDDKDKGEPAHVQESSMQVPRRYVKSERFLASSVPTMGAGKEDEFDEGTFAGIRSKRRHSVELDHREQPSLQQTGGKREGGAYLLGGAGAGGRTLASISVGRRRHSESSKERPEDAAAKLTPPLGRPYWISPSARYYVDVQECHIGVPTPANAATTTTAGLNAPLHPQ